MQKTKIDPPKPNWDSQTIFINDNLPVLRGLNSDSVDLIYLDPPFNSKRQFEAPIGSTAAGASFDDTWTLTDIDHQEFGLLLYKFGELGGKIRAVANAGWLAHGDSMFSYLLFMAPRLIECHRVLKDTGSIYLHCDPYASHYLKQLLDCIFGPSRFRNEVVWWYYNVAITSKRLFGRKHDTILFYGKGKTPVFNADDVRIDYSPDSNWVKSADSYKDKRYKPNELGKLAPDVFRIPTINNMAKERTGYPTQKPLALLHRIIKASSNPGDVILDPFCGCATTCVAAYQLERRWAGIDVSPKAGELVKQRIGDIGGMFGQIAVRSGVDLPKRTDLADDPVMTATEKRKIKPRLLAKQAGLCAACQIKTRLELMHLDRIIPGANGGEYRKSNCQLLCANCNSRKGKKTQAEFLAELERYKSQLVLQPDMAIA